MKVVARMTKTFRPRKDQIASAAPTGAPTRVASNTADRLTLSDSKTMPTSIGSCVAIRLQAEFNTSKTDHRAARAGLLGQLNLRALRPKGLKPPVDFAAAIWRDARKGASNDHRNSFKCVAGSEYPGITGSIREPQSGRNWLASSK